AVQVAAPAPAAELLALHRWRLERAKPSGEPSGGGEGVDLTAERETGFEPATFSLGIGGSCFSATVIRAMTGGLASQGVAGGPTPLRSSGDASGDARGDATTLFECVHALPRRSRDIRREARCPGAEVRHGAPQGRSACPGCEAA